MACNSQPATPPPAKHRNVLLISIDSLRADGLGCYGNPHDASPNIDRLAERGVMFERAIAAAPWTLVSHASLLSGLYPHEHGVRKHLDTVNPKMPFLTTRFRDAGYLTAAIVSGPYMGKPFQFSLGFEQYDDRIARMKEGESHSVVTSPQLEKAAGEWLRKYASPGGKPFFLFLHMWDVHYHYKPPPPYDQKFDPDYHGRATGEFRKWYRDFGPWSGGPGPPPARDLQHVRALYDGEIAFTDEHLGRVFAVLDELKIRDDTIICITGDHGDEFFEHGAAGHMRTLYGEVLRVPWVMQGPGVPARRKVGQSVSNVDILPTLLDLAGVGSKAERLSGRSWAAAIRDGASVAARPIFAETLYDLPKPSRMVKDPSIDDGRLVMVESDGWKLIRRLTPPTYERLFDLSRDPAEKNDLLLAQTARADALRKLLDSEISTAPRYTPGVMGDKGTKQGLQALGYVTDEIGAPPSASRPDAASRPDPASRSPSTGPTTTPAAPP